MKLESDEHGMIFGDDVCKLQRKCGNLSRPISRYHYHVDIESR